MHGVKRVKHTGAALEEKKKREQKKIEEYIALASNVLARKKGSDWSREAFDLTTRLLQINPEFYTIWNYRRNIFLNGFFPDSTPDQVNDLLSDELSMTTTALKSHPKVYWIWNHRRWCLENVPEGPDDSPNKQGWKIASWDRELYVLEKMLDVDPRNFHAWSYRRYVLASMPIKRSDTSELAYTTKKIESNFSNFSAWHQRSKVYTKLWGSGNADEAKAKEREFELVRNAMYTDPDDQSVWVYHRWLVGNNPAKDLLKREISGIQELLDEQSDSKWCMESLVHYKRLLLGHAADEDKIELKRQCLELLDQLKIVDPARRCRYEDLGDEL